MQDWWQSSHFRFVFFSSKGFTVILTMWPLANPLGFYPESYHLVRAFPTAENRQLAGLLNTRAPDLSFGES